MWSLGLGAAALALATACGRPPVVEAPLAASGAATDTEAPRKISPSPDRSAPVAAPEDEEGDVDAQILRSIREISPTEHVMSARAIDLFLENQSSLMGKVRVVPEGSKGIRLYGIRQDELLGRLGFENGDRIDSLMGKPLATPEQALEAYAAIRGASVIDIVVQRKGSPKKLIIRVE
jgi:general secretion pathway protein C